MGDDSINWFGYIKDRDRLEYNYYTIAEREGISYSINLNIEPGYLMGDPNYANSEAAPDLLILSFDGTNELRFEDPAEVKEMGFYLVDFEYPEPIENSFSFGGVALSGEAALFTAAIAVLASPACMIAMKKDEELTYSALDKVSTLLNFAIIIVAFPIILISAYLSEIVSNASFLYQLLYLTPAVTALGVAASVTARRMGRKQLSLLIQFAGPVLFGLILLLENF